MIPVPYINPFLRNKIFWVAGLACVIAQTIKVIIGIVSEKRFNFRWFIGTGGMPSAHAAFVSALAALIGFSFGFDSPIFALTLVFSLIIVFDAQGVRRSTGRQAEILNKMLDDIYWRKKLDNERLKELIGHTPIEVIAGIIIGVLTSIVYYYYYFSR